MELLRCDALKKSYGDKKNKTEVLHGISFSVEKGEMTAVIGASGSGKSTLLNIIGTIADTALCISSDGISPVGSIFTSDCDDISLAVRYKVFAAYAYSSRKLEDTGRI